MLTRRGRKYAIDATRVHRSCKPRDKRFSQRRPLLDLVPIREPPAERGTVPFTSADSGKGDGPRRFSDRLLVIESP
jgi:hypothetical protein